MIKTLAESLSFKTRMPQFFKALNKQKLIKAIRPVQASKQYSACLLQAAAPGVT